MEIVHILRDQKAELAQILQLHQSLMTLIRSHLVPETLHSLGRQTSFLSGPDPIRTTKGKTEMPGLRSLHLQPLLRDQSRS